MTLPDRISRRTLLASLSSGTVAGTVIGQSESTEEEETNNNDTPEWLTVRAGEDVSRNGRVISGAEGEAVTASVGMSDEILPIEFSVDYTVPGTNREFPLKFIYHGGCELEAQVDTATTASIGITEECQEEYAFGIDVVSFSGELRLDPERERIAPGTYIITGLDYELEFCAELQDECGDINDLIDLDALDGFNDYRNNIENYEIWDGDEFYEQWETGEYRTRWESGYRYTDPDMEIREVDTPEESNHALSVEHDATSHQFLETRYEFPWSGEWTVETVYRINTEELYSSQKLRLWIAASTDSEVEGGVVCNLGYNDPGGIGAPRRFGPKFNRSWSTLLDDTGYEETMDWNIGRWYKAKCYHDGNGEYAIKVWEAEEEEPSDYQVTVSGDVPDSERSSLMIHTYYNSAAPETAFDIASLSITEGDSDELEDLEDEHEDSEEEEDEEEEEEEEADITAAPDTELLFETELPSGVESHEIEWSDGDNEDSSGLFLMGYQDHIGNAAYSTAFEGTGTYEVTAEHPDGSELEAWIVSIEDEALSEPTITEMEAEPSTDDVIHADESVDITVTANDPAGNLDRVLWQEGQNQVDIWEETSVSGGEDTATITVTGPEGDQPAHWLLAGYSTLAVAITEDNRISAVESDDGPEIMPPLMIDIEETVVNEEVEITVTVQNEGSMQNVRMDEEQEITLALDGEQIDSESVSVDTVESETVTLSGDPATDTDGEVDVMVESPVDEASTTVELDADNDVNLEVNITNTNTPVDAGEFLEVTTELENTGSSEVTETVELVVGHDSEVVERETVSAAGGEQMELSLGYETPMVDNDQEFPVHFETENDDDEQIVTVYGTAESDNEPDDEFDEFEPDDGDDETEPDDEFDGFEPDDGDNGTEPDDEFDEFEPDNSGDETEPDDGFESTENDDDVGQS
ncbi:hypothetical protein [Natronorubrum sp. A-ect3]|uniref:COG1470 family protein n=1 Tax=Natronorubrum sp. A-ect3 TaxID=3242698 RepID=UPI00359E9D38